MKRLLSLVAFFATLQASAQQVNPVPDYVFRNQMSVGRGTVTDTAAYFSIGPRYGANKGFMPPIVGDTATFSSGKRNGLLIFSVQKNKFLYWDSVRVQWSDMAGSSGTYITGSGITGYVPQFNGTTTIDTSALFTLGNRLGIGSSTFAYTSTNTANVELNGTAGGILGFKRNDSARGYLWHTGDNMELANTVAGAISFNTNSATRGSISSAGVWRLNNLAGTGDRVVVASSNGTLSASTSVTGLVDTTTISTRAWRQKGDDSLGAIIATKGSGTVTSVATGYGLSGGTITTTGTLLVDTLNIATRAWRQKGLDSLAALEISGSGTTNYVPKFTGTSTIGNSIIQDNGTDVGIGSNSAGARLEILRTATGAANNNTTGSVFGSLHGSGGGPSAYGFAIRHNGSAYAGISGSNFVSQLVSSSTNSNALEMYTTGASPLVFGTSATERLRITSGGLVGINTQSPVELLSVAGSVGTTFGYSMNPSGWNGAKHRYTVPSAGDEGIISYNYNGSAVDFASYATSSIGVGNGVLRFLTGGTNAAPSERMRIFANGRVFVGASPTDAGYQFDVAGNLRTTTGANFATSSGSVGIGTASPSRTLHIYRAGVTTELYLESDVGTQAAYYLKNTSNALYMPAGRTGQMRLFVNAADRVTFDSTGFVGIGTTTPTYNLDVNGTLRSVNGANFATSSGNVGIGTASPLSKFHMSGGAATFSTSNFTDAGGTGGAVKVFSDDNNGGKIWAQKDGNLSWGYLSLQPLGGNVGIGTTSPSSRLHVVSVGTAGNTLPVNASGIFEQSGNNVLAISGGSADEAGVFFPRNTLPYYGGVYRANDNLILRNNDAERARVNSSGELLIATTSDAGDYKLQVVGNARIGTGKLDIASNTTFGLGIARSGTSEVAGQIYNSNGILYTGVESSAGGQIFTGSSAYAAVIGSGANYPLQFATNNVTRATIDNAGALLIGATTAYNVANKMEVYGPMMIRNSPTSGTLNLDSTALSANNITNRTPFQVTSFNLTGSGGNAIFYASGTWNTTAATNAIDVTLTNTASGAGSNYLRITDGVNQFRVTKEAEVVTAAPTGGSIRKWKLGEAATVSPTSPNRTIRVEIDGTVYYLHAKTTND